MFESHHEVRGSQKMTIALQNTSAWKSDSAPLWGTANSTSGATEQSSGGKLYSPVSVLCVTPEVSRGVPVAAAEDQRPALCGASLLESLRVERHPIWPGGGTDHLSGDSCFRNTY